MFCSWGEEAQNAFKTRHYLRMQSGLSTSKMGFFFACRVNCLFELDHSRVNVPHLSLSFASSELSRGKCGAVSCVSDDVSPFHTETITLTLAHRLDLITKEVVALYESPGDAPCRDWTPNGRRVPIMSLCKQTDVPTL